MVAPRDEEALTRIMGLNRHPMGSDITKIRCYRAAAFAEQIRAAVRAIGSAVDE
jgi:hypothetical protein